MKIVNSQKAKGFTIVELLTVMGVIVVLISLLLPALSMVRDFSREIQQKAQFHSIEVGVGMYENDFGSLPPSADNYDSKRAEGLPKYNGTNCTAADSYTGAMKLAEAMVGMDMLGFHPNSGFYANGVNRVRYTNAAGTIVQTDEQIYRADQDTNFQTMEENLDSRKGPYVDLENANAFRLGKVYNGIGNFSAPSYIPNVSAADGPLVLCDVFSIKRHSGEKTGTPVLYFKARTRFSRQDKDHGETTNDDYEDDEDDIYNIADNVNILDLGVANEANTKHPVIEQSTDGFGIDQFEKMIVNNKIASIKRPYRASSFILWSAGKDGLYGTSDDIFNFDKDKE